MNARCWDPLPENEIFDCDTCGCLLVGEFLQVDKEYWSGYEDWSGDEDWYCINSCQWDPCVFGVVCDAATHEHSPWPTESLASYHDPNPCQ